MPEIILMKLAKNATNFETFLKLFWILRGKKENANLSFTLRSVKFINDYVANPCYLTGGITGVLLIVMGKDVSSFLYVAIALYVIAMLIAYGIYTPLLSRQIRILENKRNQDPEYLMLEKKSNMIGATMGILVLLILILKYLNPNYGNEGI